MLQARPSEQEQLPKEEVVRRLRLLAKPATLFGEVRHTVAARAQPSALAWILSTRSLVQTDSERAARLRQVQDELQIEDEHLGGGRYNELLELQRRAKKGSAVPRSSSEAAAVDPADQVHGSPGVVLPLCFWGPWQMHRSSRPDHSPSVGSHCRELLTDMQA